MRLYNEDEVNRRGFEHGTRMRVHRTRCWTMAADLTLQINIRLSGAGSHKRTHSGDHTPTTFANHFILQLLYLPSLLIF